MIQLLPSRRKIVWSDNTYYFLTSSTFLHYPYFRKSDQKQIVLNKITEIKKVLKIPILAYSIAINHFHLKFYLKTGDLMSKIKNILHSGISREYKKLYKVGYQNFWQSSRTYYIKDENTSWKITGYIIGNLLKHREINTFDELKSNHFSSYKYTVEKFGDKMVQELVRSVIDVNEDENGSLSFEELKSIKLKQPLPWAG